MSEDTPRTAPLPKSPNFDKQFASETLSPSLYEDFRHVISEIRYLTDRIRLEIAFEVSFLAKFSHKSTMQHLNILKHLFRYLKGTDSDGSHIAENSSAESLEKYKEADIAI